VVLVELRRQGEFDTREQQQPTQYRIRYRFEQRIAALAEAKPSTTYTRPIGTGAVAVSLTCCAAPIAR
jgi:hypothetical protein